ncbi:hypothetical protein ACU686_04620 [Yinghuangia aomiensis]
MSGASGREKPYGSVVLGAAALVFLIGLLPVALRDDVSPFDAGNAKSDGGPGRCPRRRSGRGRSCRTTRTITRARRGRPGSRRRGEPSPSRARDPQADAFAAAARVGTCLNAYKTGYRDGAAWNSDVPVMVDCSADAAYARVAGVNSTCPTGESAYARLSYGDVSLCLERRFQQGQCFLVKRTGGPDSAPEYSANLFTWVDCGADRIPADFDSMLVITGVFRAPSTIPRGACSRAANDRTRYWTWVVSDMNALICATYPAR